MAATQLKAVVELTDTDLLTALVASLVVTMMGAMFSYVSSEQRVPPDHPLRPMSLRIGLIPVFS